MSEVKVQEKKVVKLPEIDEATRKAVITQENSFPLMIKFQLREFVNDKTGEMIRFVSGTGEYDEEILRFKVDKSTSRLLQYMMRLAGCTVVSNIEESEE